MLKISELCDGRGWDRNELAKRAGIHVTTIDKWYQKKSIPTIDTLKLVCAALDITLGQLFYEDSPDYLCTEKEKEILEWWNMLSVEEQEKALFLLKSLHK